MKAQFKSLCVSLVLAIGLSGCFGGATKPPDRFYRLPSVAGIKGNGQIVNGTLAVKALQTDGMHLERAIVYVESTTALELQHYHYHFWILPPTQLIQEHFISYLRERNAAKTVLRTRPGIEADATIGGYLKRFERVIGKDGIYIDIELELQYRKDRQPLLVREYRRTEKVADSSMETTVRAFGTALRSIFNEFTGELTE